MTSESLAFALAAGMLAAFNPCGFALLPAYLSLFVTGPEQERRSAVAAVTRAFVATASMTVGFLVVFATFGLALTPIASTVQRWLPIVTVVIGVALVALGLVLLAGRTVTVHLPFLRLAKDPVASPMAMALYGVSYAVASLGCTIGPFLVVTATTFRSGSLLEGIAAYATYAAGMGLVVGVLALGAALAGRAAATRMRRITPYVTRAGGALLVLAGAYVSWYGGYELRVYAGASAEDPIVDAAGIVQDRLASWVDAVGPTAFLVTLLALTATAIGVHAIARRRARAQEPTPVSTSTRRGA